MERLASAVELGERVGKGSRGEDVAESWRLTKMLISRKQEIIKNK